MILLIQMDNGKNWTYEIDISTLDEFKLKVARNCINLRPIRMRFYYRINKVNVEIQICYKIICQRLIIVVFFA
jgi:hypothetical protein